MAEAGIPDGVVNMRAGLRPHGRRSASPSIPDIAQVAFTGSTATGRRIVQASAGNLKKVQLELGGKGPNIVFDDADMPAARRRLAPSPSSTTRARPASPARA